MSQTTVEMADESDEILSRLRGISSDEKSEIGKMKCRIDDQARLIMMLKKRNDEYILANMTLDKHSIELEKQIDELNEQINQQHFLQNEIQQMKLTIEQLQSMNYQFESKQQQDQLKFASNQQISLQYQNEIKQLQQQLQHVNQSLTYSNFLLSLLCVNFLVLFSEFAKFHSRMKREAETDESIGDYLKACALLATKLRHCKNEFLEEDNADQQIENYYKDRLEEYSSLSKQEFLTLAERYKSDIHHTIDKWLKKRSKSRSHAKKTNPQEYKRNMLSDALQALAKK